MFRKILVPLDGSLLALRILRPLRELLSPRTTEVTLLRVVEPRAQDPLRSAESHMRLDLTRAQELLGLDVRTRVELVRGDPAEEIVRCARETGQDLVAMSTHGRTGLDRWLRGSVAEQVLRTCDVPLLLCSPLAFGAHQQPRFARILVALDGSERSERILPVVTGVATAHRAQVKMLRVEPLIVSEVPSPIATGSLWDPRPLEQSLGPAVERLERAGVAADACAAYGGVVAELLEAASDADLLAMTTHGRSGVSRWWFGSVAEEVLRQARCPLLVLRTPD